MKTMAGSSCITLRTLITAEDVVADLRQQGITDVRGHLAANPVLKQEALGVLFIRDLNREGLLLCGAESVAELQARLPEILLPETERMMEDLMCAMAGAGRALSELGVGP